MLTVEWTVSIMPSMDSVKNSCFGVYFTQERTSWVKRRARKITSLLSNHSAPPTSVVQKWKSGCFVFENFRNVINLSSRNFKQVNLKSRPTLIGCCCRCCQWSSAQSLTSTWTFTCRGKHYSSIRQQDWFLHKDLWHFYVKEHLLRLISKRWECNTKQFQYTRTS